LGLKIFFPILTDGNSGTGAHHAGSNASRGGECPAIYPAPVAWPGHHQQQGHQKEVGGRSPHRFLFEKASILFNINAILMSPFPAIQYVRTLGLKKKDNTKE
jgi:hypothetical protein